MGVPSGGGQNLGVAQGRINIDLSDLRNVTATTRQAGVEVERNLGRINAGAANVQRGLGSVTGALTSVAGAFGIAFGAQGLVQLGRYAVQLDEIATAYSRQRIAALNLAGSQTRLNGLLAAYDRATGGAVDRATALADVTRLQAVGFADNAQELERFVRAARAISVAMGTSQERVMGELQLAIANQSTQRLDQLGLGVAEVRQRIDELRASNSNLSQEMAYQQAILGLAQQKFGNLLDSTEAQASGAERLRREWRNMRLEMAEEVRPSTNAIMNWLATALEALRVARELDRAARGIQAYQIGMSTYDPRYAGGSGISDMARGNARRGIRSGPRFDDDQVAALRRRDEGFADIERESARERLQATRDYEEQRGEIVRNYQTQVTREAEDYARQRANQERELQESILDIQQDSARQRTRWEEDTNRAIAEAQADREKRIAEAREESAERIADIEERYNRDRERRQAAFAERLRDAAANLDAVQVRELQRRQREENEEAERARDEAIADERESLQERIDEANETFAEQERNQREALRRRIELQAEDDRLRIQEMQENWQEQREQEDIERGIRLERQAEDHNNQLGELDRQHGERIQQIKDQAQEERDQWTEESNAFLEEANIHNQAWLDEQRRINDEVLRYHEELLNAQRQALLVPGHQSLGDPYVDRALPAGATMPPVMSPGSGSVTTSSRSIIVHPGAIQIIAAPGMNEQAVGDYVLEKMAEFYEEYGNQ